MDIRYKKMFCLVVVSEFIKSHSKRKPYLLLTPKQLSVECQNENTVVTSLQ